MRARRCGTPTSAPLWDRGLHHVILFSDGVDNLVNGRWVFHPKMPCKANPLQVVARTSRWILAYLAGGTELRRVLDVVAEDPDLYIDDTSIVLDVSQL
ncbi:hypothetical protein C8F04DRAFT_1256468 [Mycena alexandri]|uniref:Uncharacterized protein n=1 Tax=Mycena alexandri TaxID=1745969 RepID=A0AAD6X617_9AGAR|nr:hypothetical protein C8F04DRAFT_1256468 [Mycena alexandri]